MTPSKNLGKWTLQFEWPGIWKLSSKRYVMLNDIGYASMFYLLSGDDLSKIHRANSVPDFLKLKSRLSSVTEELLLEQYRRWVSPKESLMFLKS